MRKGRPRMTIEKKRKKRYFGPFPKKQNSLRKCAAAIFFDHAETMENPMLNKDAVA